MIDKTNEIIDLLREILAELKQQSELLEKIDQTVGSQFSFVPALPSESIPNT